MSFSKCEWKHRLKLRQVLLAGLLTIGLVVTAGADLVLFYDIEASGFQNSALESPEAPTSSSVSARLGVSIDFAASSQDDVVPESITGLSITGNDGSVFNYTPATAGVDARRLPNSNDHEITFGGLVSTIPFMAGLSNDMRIKFSISGSTFEVLDVVENFTFVTTADPFYAAQTTTVTFVEAVNLVDSDGDGVFDPQDNCVNQGNALQRDTDNEGYGNLCDPDFNQDCVVNFLDVSVLSSNFLSNNSPLTDLNGDGSTNFLDFAILSAYFLAAPGPSGVTNVCD